MFRRLWRIAAPVVAIALLEIPSLARAGTLDLDTYVGPTISLQDLLPGMNQVYTGVTVGDKLFDDFSHYTSGGLGGALGVNPGLISVQAITIGSEEGLRFSSAKWKAFANQTQDTHFDYDVSSLLGYLVDDITLTTTGAATIDGGWQVHEDVFPSGQALNVLSTAPVVQTLSAHATFNGVLVAHVSKDIALDGGNNPPYPNAAASISDVDQTFSQVAVPLPATANMGLALLVCLGGFGAIRRMKLKKECELA